MYKRAISETLKDSNNQPMVIWDQGAASNAANATFHVIGRIYGYDSLLDLSAALKEIIEQIQNYRSDLANGFIDEHGVRTELPHPDKEEKKEPSKPSNPLTDRYYCGDCNKPTGTREEGRILITCTECGRTITPK